MSLCDLDFTFDLDIMDTILKSSPVYILENVRYRKLTLGSLYKVCIVHHHGLILIWSLTLLYCPCLVWAISWKLKCEGS